ncbi:RNA polymerase subunit sigma [Desulfosarcina sp. OttesenSCG-928-A07]|nr:RNA polymerase subunit sigma [Desulfosarcina sp. OttesenSCG-928-G17]MDL2329567.1 RNA polymerase subunit sigma [Desulfosarcina sp. OttesenSCG-928-A07]
MSDPIKTATAMIHTTLRENKPITVLTGAGISAESGIPTFRGPEGFWTIGSENYHPQEMATFSMFDIHPEEVWAWYLYRAGLCGKATPNAGHLALVDMERCLGDRFTLITQNVDNLHRTAGSNPLRMFEIHGNIFRVRCAASCTDAVWPLPKGLGSKEKGQPLTDKEREQLTCTSCGSWLRPHVLWFDETYNEHYYRFESALHTAFHTRLLVTVGTTGATNLPTQIVHQVYRNNGFLIDINVADNSFASVATRSDQGVFIQQPSSRALTALAKAVVG